MYRGVNPMSVTANGYNISTRLGCTCIPSPIASHLRGTLSLSPSGESRSAGGNSYSAYAEGSGSDEPADSSRHKRHHGYNGNGNHRCHLKGERDPEKLAELKDGRIVASRETIARA